MKVNFKSIIFSVFLSVFGACFLTVGCSQSAFAVGTLISAPSRVDMVYDDSRNTLYITSGGSVLRYSLDTNSFLPPFELGGRLMGIDISPDDNTLAVADHNLYGIHLVDLQTGESKRVVYKSKGERGTFAVAFSGNDTVLVTSSFDGSGWVPMRKYNLSTDTFTILLDSVRQDTMVSASADNSVIGFAENNISDGPFGCYRTKDGRIIRKDGYEDGTGWFNYEIAANRNGTQYAIPTGLGTFLADGDLVKFAIIGDRFNGQPTGVAYNPVKDIVYFPWAETSQVYAYDTNTLLMVGSYDFENIFDYTGNHAYVEGRVKISRDGRYLFVTVQNGVRYVDLSLTSNETAIKKLTSPDPSVHMLNSK
jgi:hypothetical protein